jgi:beta-lactamase superfamily II metal-dependent hydrolase
MDGGVPGEVDYLRGFLAPLGNEVEAWFVSHPHLDHTGALNEILKNPKGINIKSIYHSELSRTFYEREPNSVSHTEDFYNNLQKTQTKVENVVQLGRTVEIDKVTFKILALKNEEIITNPYNNSSMIIRVSDKARSAVFLGDAGVEEGDKLLNGGFRKELDCDYLQMAHHGQNGVSREFYRSINFKACIWPTPLWLWTNNNGTGPFKTLDTRAWIDELNIQKRFLMWEGLSVIV